METFLTLLAHAPGHAHRAARRRGARGAVSQQARAALAAGGVRSAAGRARDRRRWIAALRDARNRANPGTTADLTAAAIFVVLLGGGWRGPAASEGPMPATR